ncbi:hypothetical protein HY256_11345, partial [Candidatus Sumerlaeota bacterium]|nr:hypothetical protein [Candidatus Sumerlaeota bacterium]
LDEYLWIHGLMVREILSMDAEDNRKAALEEALTRLSHLKSSTTVVRDGDFDPEIYRTGLNHYYEGERRLDIAMTAGFQSPPLLVGIIDVLAANHTSPRGSQTSSSPNP